MYIARNHDVIISSFIIYDKRDFTNSSADIFKSGLFLLSSNPLPKDIVVLFLFNNLSVNF